MEKKRLTSEEFVDGQIEMYNKIKKCHALFEGVVKSVDFPFEYEEEAQVVILKEYHALEDYRDAMLRRMRYYKSKMKELAELDRQREDADDECSHCGQDATDEAPQSLKELLGMEVVGVGRGKCEGCPNERHQVDCHKVWLAGGDYLCLAMPGYGEDGDGAGNVIAGIKEQIDGFMNYLDEVTRK